MQRVPVEGEEAFGFRSYRLDVIGWVLALLPTIALGLLWGLRSYSVGIDTYRYVERYLSGGWTISDFFAPGYMFIVYICRLLSPDSYSLLFTAMGLLSGFFLTRGLVKYSSNPWFGFLIILSFGYVMEGFNQYRQLLAMVLILNSLGPLNQGSAKGFAAWVLAAASIHTTALIFVPVWFFRHYKVTFTGIALVSLLSVVLFAIFPKLSGFLAAIPYYGSYIGSVFDDAGTAATWLNCLFRTGLLLFIVSLFKKSGRESSLVCPLVVILLFGLVFQVGSLASTVLGRICSYFVIFYAIALPDALNEIDRKTVRWLLTVFFIGLFWTLLVINIQAKFPYEKYRYSLYSDERLMLVSRYQSPISIN